MKILLVAATSFEIQPLLSYLEAHFETVSDFIFKGKQVDLEILITGVGLPLTAYHLGKTLSNVPYHLAVQAGIAGAFDKDLELGDVIEVVSDCFGDLGIEQADGQFASVHEMKLVDKDVFPFKNGRLWNNPHTERAFLPKAHGISVNKVHGQKQSIENIQSKFPFAQVESMEGAAFFHACLLEKIKFLQIRSISNYVEPRNKDAWELELAITNLNVTLIEMLTTIEKIGH